MVDGGAVDWLSDESTRRVRKTSRLGTVCRDADLPGPGSGPWPAGALVSLALYRGPYHGRGDERARLHGHRPLRQAAPQTERRAASPGDAVEVRLQVGQGDH